MSPFSRICQYMDKNLAGKSDERKQAGIGIIAFGAALLFAGGIVKDVHEISPVAGTVFGLVLGWSISAFGLAVAAFGCYLMSAPPTTPKK